MMIKNLIITSFFIASLLNNVNTSADESYFNSFQDFKTRPLVIGRRGYSSKIPENTLASFEASLYEGADFVQFEIQVTKDYQMVVLSTPMIGNITNVNEFTYFRDRIKQRQYQNKIIEDFWVCDFTLDELTSLNVNTLAKDQVPHHTNNKLQIPSLQETFDFIIAFNQLHKGTRNTQKRNGGLVIEVGSVDFHRDYMGMELGLYLTQYLDSRFREPNEGLPIILYTKDFQTLKFWNLYSLLPTAVFIDDVATLPLYCNHQQDYANIFMFDLHFLQNREADFLYFMQRLHKIGKLGIFKVQTDDEYLSQSITLQNAILAFNSDVDGVITDFSNKWLTYFQYFSNNTHT